MALALHPDRLLPAEPGVRAIARELYGAVRELPVISPHGHVDPRVLLDDEPFGDPASLLVTPDHYVTRLLHASGVGLDELGVAQGPLLEEGARAVWRRMCAHWHVFRGTPVRYWLEHELVEIFGIALRPSAASADALYDELTARLAEPAFRPRALYDRFRIAVLATTDDPCDDLAAHAALGADPTWSGRVIPTFRPDRYLEPATPGWPELTARLAQCSGIDTGDYPGFVAAMEARRRHFTPTARRRLTTATRTCARTRSSRRWPTASTAPPSPARRRRRRPWRCAGTCCSRWPGCPARTAW